MLSFEFLKGLFARHEYMCSSLSTVYTANLSYLLLHIYFGNILMWSSLQIPLTIALTTERKFCQERNVRLDNVLKKKTKREKLLSPPKLIHLWYIYDITVTPLHKVVISLLLIKVSTLQLQLQLSSLFVEMTSISKLFIRIPCLNIEISPISQNMHAPNTKHSFQHSFVTIHRHNSVSCVTWIRKKVHMFKLIAMKTKTHEGLPHRGWGSTMGPKISWRQRHNRINTHWSKNGKATQPLYVSFISCLQKKYWCSLVKGNVTDRGEKTRI